MARRAWEDCLEDWSRRNRLGSVCRFRQERDQEAGWVEVVLGARHGYWRILVSANFQMESMLKQVRKT